MKAIVVVDSVRETGDKIEHETRLYITSLQLPADQLGVIVRSHWAKPIKVPAMAMLRSIRGMLWQKEGIVGISAEGIENSLHWVMDMAFRDDECRIRTEHALANFTTIKHLALNLLRRAPGKDSLRLRRKVAAWDDKFLAAVISR